jgi:three-Cys-motif partner protein
MKELIIHLALCGCAR